MELIKKSRTQFQDILRDIRNWIGQQTTFNQNSIFGQLITVISGSIQFLLFYIEDALQEQNKYTATHKKSIYGLASLSGYDVSLGKTTGCYLRVSPKLNYDGTKILLNNNTRIVCSSNYYFFNIKLDTNSLILDSKIEDLELFATQGAIINKSFTAKGQTLEVISLEYDGFIDKDYIELKVNNKTWTQKASLYDMSYGEEAYTTKLNPIGGLDIVFGNTQHGKLLNEGDNITISYLQHDGEIDIKQDSSFTFADSLYSLEGEEIDANEFFDIKLLDEKSIVLGSNPEDIETTKHMIGFNSRNLILNDEKSYKNFLKQWTWVGYNRVWSTNENMEVNILVVPKIKSYKEATDSDFLLNKTQKDLILGSMKEYSIAGVEPKFVDPLLYKYSLNIFITTKNNQNSLLKEQIKDKIYEFFNDDLPDFFIPTSDIIKLLKDNFPEIDSLNVNFISKEDEDAKTRGYYKKDNKKYYIWPGQEPMLGLDELGNIQINNPLGYPILKGGWKIRDTYGNDVIMEDINIVLNGKLL